MPQRCSVEINTEALRHNARHLKNYAPASKLMAVVKSDAYGHGLLNCVSALDDIADAFAVTDLTEALQCRQANIKQPIIILSGCFLPDELPLMAQAHLSPIVHSSEQLPALLAYQGAPLTLWLKLNIGMHRLGFNLEGWTEVIKKLKKNNCLKIEGIMGHLSNAALQADHTTCQQVQAFIDATAGAGYERSLAKSAGVLGWPRSHLEWIRPGIALYGISPYTEDNSTGNTFGLKPVMRYTSSIMAIRDVKVGDKVGYNGLWEPSGQNETIGLVSCGYGDGYPRCVADKTPILVNGEQTTIIGRISMDLLYARLTGLPQVKVGDPVVLWGPELNVEKIAEHAGTIGYELLCHAGKTRLRQSSSSSTG